MTNKLKEKITLVLEEIHSGDAISVEVLASNKQKDDPISAAKVAFIHFRDSNNLAASDFNTADVGTLKLNGEPIGRFSYNGRFWDIVDTKTHVKETHYRPYYERKKRLLIPSYQSVHVRSSTPRKSTPNGLMVFVDKNGVPDTSSPSNLWIKNEHLEGMSPISGCDSDVGKMLVSSMSQEHRARFSKGFNGVTYPRRFKRDRVPVVNIVENGEVKWLHVYGINHIRESSGFLSDSVVLLNKMVKNNFPDMSSSNYYGNVDSLLSVLHGRNLITLLTTDDMNHEMVYRGATETYTLSLNKFKGKHLAALIRSFMNRPATDFGQTITDLKDFLVLNSTRHSKVSLTKRSRLIENSTSVKLTIEPPHQKTYVRYNLFDEVFFMYDNAIRNSIIYGISTESSFPENTTEKDVILALRIGAKSLEKTMDKVFDSKASLIEHLSK